MPKIKYIFANAFEIIVDTAFKAKHRIVIPLTANPIKASYISVINTAV